MKLKRYHIITLLLTLYALFMTLFFGLDLLKSGEKVRFWVTLGCELVVIILAFFFLKKRDEMRIQRKNLNRFESKNDAGN